jgi:hypothetical protein
MSIEGLIGGVMLLVAAVSDGSVDSRTVYQSLVLVDRALQKKDWAASAHEEAHSGLKNIILKLGRQ